jgi:hypothetical protein
MCRARILTIKDWLESWIKSERENIKFSTGIGYDNILRYHLIRSFGQLTLADLRREHIRDWIAQHPSMSAKRIRNILSVLRVALDAAVEREMIDTNPLVGFKYANDHWARIQTSTHSRHQNDEQSSPHSKDRHTTLSSSPSGPAYAHPNYAHSTGPISTGSVASCASRAPSPKEWTNPKRAPKRSLAAAK